MRSSRRWIVRILRLDEDFRLITALIFVLGGFNILYKFQWTEDGITLIDNLWNPSWLLFGPLLYCAYRALANNPVPVSWKHSVHFLPFVSFMCFYGYVSFIVELGDDQWKNTFFSYYQNSYWVIVFSLMTYSTYVLSKILLVNTKNKPDGDALVIAIAAIFVLISVLISMMIISWSIIRLDMGIDFRYLSYSLLFFSLLAIGWYWAVGDKKSKQKKQVSKSIDSTLKGYKNSTLTDEMALVYKERITAYFDSLQAYLSPNLSLDHLSKELDIPKHLFSQLFNVYFGKSYHAFVADYRILHAVELLNNNHGKLKIESLCYSCGFNSKTSFNRYFKERTGLTPSEYQIQLTRQIA